MKRGHINLNWSILSFIMPIWSYIWAIYIHDLSYYILSPQVAFYLTYIFLLVGIIFGIVGLAKQKKSKGFAIAGIILSILGILSVWLISRIGFQ